MIVLKIIFIITLLAAVYMDIRTQEVYDFVWFIAIICATAAMIIGRSWNPDRIISLSVYFFIQEVIMQRSYGKADCHAFSACAIMLSADGSSLIGYTVHMLISSLLLVIVQGIKRNIKANGRLKVPVPMIPYIASGYLIMSGMSGIMSHYVVFS